MFELSAVGQALADPASGRFLRVNRAFCELTGYSREELLQMAFSDLSHPDDRVGDAVPVRRVVEGRTETWTGEKRYVRKDGGVLWVHVMGTLIRDAAGSPLRTFAAILDLTEMEQVAAALARSRAEFQAMFDSLLEAVVFADTRRRIVMVNPAFTALFGYQAGEVIGRTTEFLYAERDDYLTQGRLRYGSDAEPPAEPYVIRYRRRDGTVLLGESAGTQVRDQQGRLLGFVSLHRDVTESRAAKELLEKSERDYRTLATNLPGMVYRVYLREGRKMHFFNDLLQAMTGYSAEELSRGDVCQLDPLIVAEDRPAVVLAVERAIQERQSFDITYRVRTRQGELRHFAERGRPIYGEDDRPLYIDGVIFDVTMRRRAEEALAESEERFRQLAENVEQVFFLITPDWNEVLYVSPAYEEVWGRSCQSLYERPRSWLKAVIAADRPRVLDAIAQGVVGNVPKMFPAYRIRRPDGTERWIEARGWPILDEQGDVYRVAGIAEDITERKRAEEALRQGRDELQAIYDSAFDGLLIGDMETNRIVGANPALSRLLGYSPGELLTMSIADIHPPDAAPEMLERFANSPTAESRVIEAAPVLAKDGRVLRVDISGRRVVFGGRLCTFGFFHDVTEHMQMQAELQQATIAAEAASEAKSRFLANTSHDLRTPLNAIMGMTGLALAEDLSPVVRDYLETAKDAATILLDLLNDVLDFSRIEAGQLELKASPFHLRQTVEQIVRALGLRAYEKGLELVCDCEGDLPEHVVGDPLRLRQILMNLVGNALKFTLAGEIVVRLEAVSRRDREVFVRISVTDTGIGIAREDQRRIFEPFHQVDGSTTREHGGSGLGLAIAANLVQRMGGQITVESEPGQGATFAFTLPMPVASPPEEATEGFGPATEQLRDLPVLIVTESAAGRRMLHRRLADWSLKPETVLDGPGALARLNEAAAAGQPFRLVLSERSSGRIDGLALAQALRREPSLAAPVILMVPAAVREREPPAWAEAGATCLQKPVTSSNLLAAVQEALDLATRERPVRREACQPPESPSRLLDILVAEDSAAGQKFIERLLSSRGHRVTVAGDGRQALKMIQRQDFDVVLMDVQMPRQDGLQTTAAIRALADQAKAQLPIVALTAHAFSGETEKCLAAGMDAYLSKPVDTRQLIELVERLAAARPAGQPDEPAPHAVPDEVTSGVFDPDEALHICFGNHGVLHEMIECFFSEAHSMLSDMGGATAAGDGDELARLAHRLRTTLVYLAAQPAAEAARRIEDIGRSGVLDGADEALGRLARQIQILARVLSEHRLEPGGGAAARCESKPAGMHRRPDRGLP
jgi:two-component system sensor histidine kinase/response regulator